MLSPFDSIHFRHTVTKGYTQEMNHAFFPLTGYLLNWVMKIQGPIFGYIFGWELEFTTQVVGFILALAIGAFTAVLIYKVC